MRSLFSWMLLALVIGAAQSALANEVVVLNGPRADAWRKALAEYVPVSEIQEIDGIPEQATLVIPDRLLTEEELARLEELPQSVRVLALGRSAYSEKGSSAARLLGVGKHYQYLPLLYPEWIDHDMERYKEIARWTAEQGAHGVGVFSYVYTLPGRSDEPNFEGVRDVFRSFESWKTPEAYDDPRSPGLKETPLLLFMHASDTRRAGPEEAIAWAQELHANTVSVEVSRVRTRGVYPSRFTYEEEVQYKDEMRLPDNDLDYLPRLLKAAEEADIAVHANLMTSHSPRPTEPHERQRMASDVAGEDEFGRGAPCPVAGERHYDDMAAMAEEILRKYPQVAAIELDEPRIYCRSWTDWACFCQACQEVFEERYGYELTPTNVINYPHLADGETIEQHTTEGGRQTINDDFHEFRVWMMDTLIIEKFRRAINRVRPGTPLVVWQPTTYEAFGFSASSAIMHGASVFGPEYKKRPGPSRYLNHAEAFHPRHERIVRTMDVQSADSQTLNTEIVRVDLFAQAQPLMWGESEDESRWVLLTSAGDGRVMYAAFDPLHEGEQTNAVLDRIFDWVRTTHSAGAANP